MIRPGGALLACLGALAALGAGCGQDIDVPKDSPERSGAELFAERCSGCHTLDVVGAQGSKPPGEVEGGERTNGPNFNDRVEDREAVLYAIRNGGFSGSIMPANIVVGEDAEKVADFVAKYAGREKGEAGGGETGQQSPQTPGSAGEQ